MYCILAYFQPKISSYFSMVLFMLIFVAFCERLCPSLIFFHWNTQLKNGGRQIKAVLEADNSIIFQLSQNELFAVTKNSFCGNHYFLNLTLFIMTFVHTRYRCGNYSREETICGNTVSNRWM